MRINEVGQFVPADWWAVIFNPSFPYRLVHMVLAAYLTTAFVVGAVGACHLLRDRGERLARVMFSMAMWMAAMVAPIQIVAGDPHGLNTLEHQPAKIAAMEGHFETQAGAPLMLFGIPDMEQERTLYAIGIPKLGSLILTHDWNGEVKGLECVAQGPAPERDADLLDLPHHGGPRHGDGGAGPVEPVAALARPALRHAAGCTGPRCLMGPMGFVAVLAGWVTTEVGRQPYTVYGLLATAQSVSPIAAAGVGASLIAFIIVYFAVFGAGVFYILRLMSHRPMAGEPDQPGRGADPRRRHHAGTGQRQWRHRRVRSAMIFDLAFIWAGLIAFAVLAYVVLDGFDLGVGILFPFVEEEAERDQMMNSVAPVWDGNETWLVLGGGGLFAVFPLAYAVIMPALYVPIIVMLLGLVFRGVAFEFRWRTQRGKFLWDWAFAGGSTAGGVRAGHCPGGAGPGHPGRRPRLCRRLVGLADAVQRADRRGAGGGLCAARRHLAGHEDRRRGAAARLRPGLGRGDRHAGPDRCGQPVDAVSRTRSS